MVQRALFFLKRCLLFRAIKEDIEKTEKAIAACNGPAAADTSVRRSLISLHSHRETKVRFKFHAMDCVCQKNGFGPNCTGKSKIFKML